MKAPFAATALTVSLFQSAVFPQTQDPRLQQQSSVQVERIDSTYSRAPRGNAGTFVTGQPAELMLGGFGFNRSGGPLTLNHPTGLATDGRRLVVADRWNNRVLIWSTAPARNEPPQLVLGQRSFDTNDPGQGLDGLNWPGNVSLGENGKLAVADTNNDRVLLWSAFPTRNGQSADLELRLEAFSSREDRERVGWPWGVWTNGSKLAVVATHGSAVLIWNQWPARDGQAPDFILRPEHAGTPRNITSDGEFLLLSDHNYRGVQRPGPSTNSGRAGMAGGPATIVWNQWPRQNGQVPDFLWPEWCKGTATPDGGLILAGIQSVFIWKKRPTDAETNTTTRLMPTGYRNGDGPDAVIAAGRLFVCNYNGNNILAWNRVPTSNNTPPDFAIGSENPSEDVWAKRFCIQNPVVATNGEVLVASSDFDRKMFLWKQLPGETGAKPDFVFHLSEGPWDNALHGTNLVLGGRGTLYLWKTLPVDGHLPDAVLQRKIGRAELREITGVALDDRHLYVADRQANCVYVWNGIPGPDTDPVHVLEVANPGRLSSNGEWLCIAPFEGQEIVLRRVSDLGGRPISLGGRGKFNLPGKAIIAGGRLFVADTSFNRVDIWNDVNAALQGASPDTYLGASGIQDHSPGIGQNRLFMPGTVAFDGSSLWVGEFKFSTRILRFSPSREGGSPGARPAAVRERQDKPQGGATDWAAYWSQGRGQGRGPVALLQAPVRIDDLDQFVPYGLTAGAHVCPIDHCYFFPKPDKVANVLAPADGFVVAMAHRTQLTGSTETARSYDDYALILEHSATFFTQFDLLTSLDDSLLAALEPGLRSRITGKEMLPQTFVRIPVKAGQILGKVSGRSLDFGVINTEKTLPGFLTPSLYGHYSWRIHLADPFDHFAEPARSQLLKLNVRREAPFGGRIDYDIRGKLCGNWFLEGSGGYAGNRNDPRGYWMGHLAFFRHHADPTRIVISVGDYAGRPASFQVQGNAPDPETVGVKSGPMRFELIFSPIDGYGRKLELPPGKRGVQGVALAQVLEGERLQFEVFPGAKSSDVRGFTGKARRYER